MSVQTKVLYMDSIEANYIKEFEATILDAGEDFVILDQTAFYPLGGGQPSDSGFLERDGKRYRVKEVLKKGIIMHKLESKEGLAVGDMVKGILDWDKRFAHMRMHTAQHLISAMVYDTYGARTVGNQIYADRSRIDFEPLDHEMADMGLIEEKMNEFVKAAMPVVITQEKRCELEKVVDCKKCNLDLLPPAIQDLRIVRVGDVDVCPCAGTHVRNASELGAVKLLKKENKGKARVRITYELVL